MVRKANASAIPLIRLCSSQSDAGWEEYYDYIFPEDAANQPNRKLLAMVKLWKKQQMVEDAPEDEGASPSAEQQAAPTQTDTSAGAGQEPETAYDDRDDSSSSSESDGSDGDSGEKQTKQSQDPEKD